MWEDEPCVVVCWFSFSLHQVSNEFNSKSGIRPTLFRSWKLWGTFDETNITILHPEEPKMNDCTFVILSIVNVSVSLFGWVSKHDDESLEPISGKLYEENTGSNFYFYSPDEFQEIFKFGLVQLYLKRKILFLLFHLVAEHHQSLSTFTALSQCTTVPLYHCPTVTLDHCTTGPLHHAVVTPNLNTSLMGLSV